MAVVDAGWTPRGLRERPEREGHKKRASVACRGRGRTAAAAGTDGRQLVVAAHAPRRPPRGDRHMEDQLRGLGDGELPAAAESRQVAGRNGDRKRGRRRVAAPALRLAAPLLPVTIGYTVLQSWKRRAARPVVEGWAKETETGSLLRYEYLIFGERIFFPHDNCGAHGYN